MSVVASTGQPPPGSRRTDLAIAAVEASCGVLAAGYLVVIGVRANSAAGGPGQSAVDRLFPFAMALLVLAVVLAMSLRSYRRAAGQDVLPDNAVHASPPPDRMRNSGSNAAPTPVGAQTLSAEGRRELARVVALLADAGLFAPQIPSPRDLAEAVADAGEPVTVDTVLTALQEADFWRPGFQPDHYLAALAFHHSHMEQDRDSLQAQVDDLSRLVRDPSALQLDQVHSYRVGGTERTRLDLTVDGDPYHLDYASHPKQLSTVLHVTAARALQTRSREVTHQPRLAWLWTDQGVWLAAFDREATLRHLNTALAAGTESWSWIDQEAIEDTLSGP